jgi:hypothetical protein
MTSAVDVAAFSTETEARVCVSYLRAHGVEAALADEMIFSVLPFLSPGKKGFRVTAPAEQARLAAELLAAVADADEEAEEKMT